MPNTREKLIELLRKVQYQGNAVHGYHDKYIQNGELADHLISHGVTVQEWISVKEKLPEDTEEYWIAYKAGGDYYYSTGYFDGKCWCSVLTHHKINVTHWMPLPEPPTTCHMTREQQPKGE